MKPEPPRRFWIVYGMLIILFWTVGFAVAHATPVWADALIGFFTAWLALVWLRAAFNLGVIEGLNEAARQLEAMTGDFVLLEKKAQAIEDEFDMYATDDRRDIVGPS